MKDPQFGSNRIQSFIDFDASGNKVRLGAEGLALFAEVGTEKAYLTNPDGTSFFNNVFNGVYFVDMTNGSDSNDGYTWLTPLKTIQAAIDLAVEGAGTKIYCTGSATLTAPILWNKTNLHLYGYPAMDNHTGGNCSLTISTDDTPLFLISKTKARFEGLRVTLANTKCVAFSVYDNQADSTAAVALSNCMFKNLNIYKSTGSNGEGNAFRLGSSTACTFENIKIVAASGKHLLGGFLFVSTVRSHFKNIVIGNCAGTAIYDPGSTNTVYEGIVILNSCLVGCDIAGATSILMNSRIMATTAYGGNDSIQHVGNLIDVDI